MTRRALRTGRRGLAPLLAAAAALALPSAALAAQERPLPATPPTTPADVGSLDRIIVEWEAGVTSSDRVSARDDADTGLVRTLGNPSFQLVKPQQGQTVAAALAALRADPAVRLAERDGFSVLHATTNDPLFGQLWGLQNLGLGIKGAGSAVADDDVDADRAWDRTRGSSSVVIADLDAGYRFDHPDLAAVAWTNPADPQNGVDDDRNGIVDDTHGADFVGSSADAPATDGDPTDDNLIDGGHGVHTAGTMGAAGDNGVGVSGVSQDVRIMPLRVCAYSTSASATRCPVSSQIEAINYAGSHGARAANMSLGGTSFSTMVRDAFARNPRTLFVISAGNDAQDNDPSGTPHYPCVYDPTTSGISGAVDNIVCVAATDQADALASFSDWGRTTVDLGAPGTEILSVYPASVTPFSDDFETDTFASRWTNGGSGFARAASGDGPLTSFGITDSPGAAPVASSFHQVTLTSGVTVPAGAGSCQLRGRRFVSLGANGAFTYYVIPSVGGTLSFSVTRSTSGSTMAQFNTVPVTGLAGASVRVRFEYTAPSASTDANGVWLDDLKLTCYAPLSTPPDYGFLDGTSMAAPHVTGAAGLLFSLKPSATVAEVKAALLASVDPVPSLAGRTVTGGRLNVADALDVLVPPAGGTPPPDTAITSAPASETTSTTATFAFGRIGDIYAASFECQLDGGAFQACTSPAAYPVAVGAHTFAVRARSKFGVASSTPATATWTVVAPPVVQPPGGGGGGGSGDGSGDGSGGTAATVRCVVPKLAGKTLAQAKAALRRAHCALGRVTKPRARRGRRLPALVVKSSSPGVGARRAAGAKVALTLKAKPRARARRRARR